ncbi:hypothetical protein H0H93_013317 [Arthromyces matolae]|nr:hypothetical protein H0H93_013317 [Arthromyces matolae]
MNKLLELQKNMDETIRQADSWNRFMKATAIANAIAGYREQINDMRLNFTLDVVVRIKMEISQQKQPQHLEYTVNLLYFVDAMNDKVPVPMDQCLTPRQFHDYINFRFYRRLGYEVIARGDYVLSLLDATGAQQPLTKTRQWTSLVQPGVTITMDIVSRPGSERLDDESRRCPSCQTLCRGANLGDEVICSQCSTLFRISQAAMEEVNHRSNTSSRSNSSTNAEESKMTSSERTPEYRNSSHRYFRRFRILLEGLSQPSSIFAKQAWNYRMQLHTVAQRSGRLPVEYREADAWPSHPWRSTVHVQGELCGTGQGNSKGSAREQAARKAIEYLGRQPFATEL